MKKKTLNILMIISFCLMVVLIIFSIFLLSWCLSKLSAIIRGGISFTYPDKSYYTKSFAFSNLNILIIFSVILFALSAFTATVLALIFKLLNKEEIESYSIDFKARRAEKKRLKTEAEKERLKAKLEELEEESKE